MNTITSAGFVPGFVPKQILVTINYHFFIRKEVDRFGLSTVYLSISQKGERRKINLKIKGLLADWNEKKQRFKENSKSNQDANMILNNYQARISDIITVFRLNNRNLTIPIFIEEFRNAVPRADFLEFFNWALENKTKQAVKFNTYRKHKSVLQKLYYWKKEIPFYIIDKNFFKEFRQFFKSQYNNQPSTINSNIAVIKKYITLAENMKIPLTISPNEIVAGSTAGNKQHLKPNEVRKLRQFYFTVEPQYLQKQILGYFLFACFTGLRLSDVKSLRREQVEQGVFTYIPKKTASHKNIEREMVISPLLQEIIADCPQLFTSNWPSDQYINRELKNVARVLKINSRISFHSGRHTFATNYLRTGGKVERLRVLLGHSNLATTMAYVHIVENEVMDDVLELDTVY